MIKHPRPVNDFNDLDRVRSDAELPLFSRAFDALPDIIGRALKVLLLTGQRPGEVCGMRREHIKNGWWEMPGKSTKNKQGHRVWLMELIGATGSDACLRAL